MKFNEFQLFWLRGPGDVGSGCLRDRVRRGVCRKCITFDARCINFDTALCSTCLRPQSMHPPPGPQPKLLNKSVNNLFTEIFSNFHRPTSRRPMQRPSRPRAGTTDDEKSSGLMKIHQIPTLRSIRPSRTPAPALPSELPPRKYWKISKLNFTEISVNSQHLLRHRTPLCPPGGSRPGAQSGGSKMSANVLKMAHFWTRRRRLPGCTKRVYA